MQIFLNLNSTRKWRNIWQSITVQLNSLWIEQLISNIYRYICICICIRWCNNVLQPHEVEYKISCSIDECNWNIISIDEMSDCMGVCVCVCLSVSTAQCTRKLTNLSPVSCWDAKHCKWRHPRIQSRQCICLCTLCQCYAHHSNANDIH